MTIRKKILHITGGSQKYGFGHIRRSKELLKTLQRWFDVSFYTYIEGEHPVSLRMIGGPLLDEPFKKEICDGLLIDMPEPYAAAALKYYVATMPETVLIALGCYLSIGSKPDIVINLDEMGGALPHSLKRYVGLQYGIIREDFFRYRNKSKVSQGQNDVVISIGGADVGQLSESLVKLFDENLGGRNDIFYHLILGPFSEKRIYGKKRVNLNIYHAPVNVEELMSRADVAISNGGTTLLEYTFLGVPVIVIPQTPHEEIFARKFEEAGAAIVIRKEEVGGKLCPALLGLVDSKDKRMGMGEAGKRMNDGLGRNRIAQIIREAVESGSRYVL